MCTLLLRSVAKVISEALSDYICKFLWSEKDLERETETSIQIYDELLMCYQGSCKQEEEQGKRKTLILPGILRYISEGDSDIPLTHWLLGSFSFAEASATHL